MKRVLIALLLACLPAVAAAETLTVATFNAEFLTRPKVHLKFGLPFNLTGAVKEEWEAPGFRDQKFAEAAQEVASVIAALEADVVALTEAGNLADVNELNELVRAQGVAYDHVAVCACTDRNTHQHVAVLSKFTLSDVLGKIPGREGFYKEPDDPDSESDTGLSKGMRVTFAADGQTIHLYVVHLASERGGHEKDAQRTAQASIVRRHSLELLNRGEHVIVAGDLNDYRGQPAIRRIRGLDDIWPDLVQTGLARYFAKDALDTRWTYEFQGARNQIDHVLLSSSLKNATKRRGGIKARVISHGNDRASDHRPLIVTLDFRSD